MGQKLVSGRGGCVPIFSSVSGRVAAIEPREHPGGKEALSIVLENDFQNILAPHIKKRSNVLGLSAGDMLRIIQETGIAGKGGASFPSHARLSAHNDPLAHLIINACECEPYITADDSLMTHYPRELILGIELITKIFNPRSTIIAIENNKPSAIRALTEHIGDRPIEIRVLPAKYPLGAKEQLVQSVTGREIPPGGDLLNISCAIYNVFTCFSVYKAIYEGRPIFERIVTVTGGAIKKPENFMVRIGTPLSCLVEAAGGFVSPPHKIIAGGPMMGIAQSTLEAPVLRNMNAVLCLGEEDRVTQAHPTCLRCGKCLSVCPMHLQPLYLYRYETTNNQKGLRRLHIEDCNECGCCAYICPGKIPLVEYIKAAKKRLNDESEI